MTMEMEGIQNSSPESNQIQVWKSNGFQPINYTNETHLVRLFEVFQSLRKDGVLCDIRLQTDDGTIVFAHKLVLVSASPYFCAMLTGRFDESNQDLINLTQLDSTVLQLLIDYSYTGQIMVTEDNVQVLLSAADLLQFDYVRGVCSEFMKTTLNPSNCVGIKAFAELYKCTDLLSSCEKYINKQFLEVCKYEEFLSLSAEEVIEIISRNDLAVICEEKVFECVINWVRHELDARKDSLPKLMEHVRLPLTSIEYISEKVFQEPLLEDSLICKNYIIEALTAIYQKPLFTTIRTTPRWSGQVIIVFSRTQANWYDPETNLWHIVPGMRTQRIKGSIALISEHLVFSVGGEHNDCPRSVEMLDLSLQSLSWRSTVDMISERSGFGVGVLNECIYAVGGYDNKPSDCVELFDIRTQKWQKVSCMIFARANLGVGVLNNCLYALGGNFEGDPLYYVEFYDPSRRKWENTTVMSEYRNDLSVGVLNGLLYAIGGHNRSGDLKSVEAYTPTTGNWSSIAHMHVPRTRPGVFILGGLLHVIGGRNEGADLDSMEIYNPKTNVWIMKPSPIFVDGILGGVVIDRPSYF